MEQNLLIDYSLKYLSKDDKMKTDSQKKSQDVTQIIIKFKKKKHLVNQICKFEKYLSLLRRAEIMLRASSNRN